MARAPRKTAAAPAVPSVGTNYPVLNGKAQIALVEEYVAAKAQIAVLEGRLEELKVGLLKTLEGAPVAYIGARTVSVSEVRELPPVPARVITKEMVGQQISGMRGRAGYQQIRVQ